MTDVKTDRYRETIFLPHTSFPMKAGLPVKEPEILKRWQEMDMYARLREQSKGREKFVLHDGPPYANGNIHIGHALNKILKDLITRSRQMAGYDSNYVPGWDCHGLPIEWKIEEQYRAKGKNKDAVPVNEFREECRQFAKHWIGVQREEFERLGVVGDFKNPYLTMNFEAEAIIARELMKFSESDQLYRGSKPVMWSVVEKTALAEAEIEYQDYVSDAIYVKFPVKAVLQQGGFRALGEQFPLMPLNPNDLVSSGNWPTFENACVVIWTTTPWTIPGNRALSFSSKIACGIYQVTAAPEGNWARVGEKYILADKLAEDVMKAAKVEAFERIAGVDPSVLVCGHPLAERGPSRPASRAPQGEDDSRAAAVSEDAGNSPHAEVPGDSRASKHEGGYGFDVPLLDGDHVTDDAGTGFVHTAPGHGADDYNIWMANRHGLTDRGIETKIPYTVDADGRFTKEAPGFEGKTIITAKGDKGDANEAVISALKDAGMLVARGRLNHQYPHSWRSKKPIIFRNTPQWFIAMDKVIAPTSSKTPGKVSLEKDTLRARSLKAISETQFVPPSGQNRLRGMIEAKPDWVISRQRAWGVPIAVFVHKETGKILNDNKVNQRIYDSFCEEGADAWFADGAAQRFLGNEYKAEDYEQVRDILDVWFDSGSTHAFCLEMRPDLKWPADVYLEGSDQHRGWFHSSLIESCGTRGRAPYSEVITHGFTMAEDGRKMSKSLGNIVSPQDVIKQSGADILRLWVATCDYTDDQRIGPEVLKTNVETYRKLRNSFRYMLGALDGLKDWEQVHHKDMPELERYILHKLHELGGVVAEAYQTYDYKRLSAALINFMSSDLSAFYFDIRKDSLYCDAWSSLRRRSCRSVMDQLFHCLTTWWAPVLAFTAEEVWLSRFSGEGSSVHLMPFAKAPDEWRDDELAKKWDLIRNVRR
ncbi:MAG: isoleucine--tRNA ligase, partial [Aestuariivirga sp.]